MAPSTLRRAKCHAEGNVAAMCTVTWLKNDGVYQLFSSHHELRSLVVAERPTLARAAGVRYIAPCDAARGGTWVAVNEHGLSVCLLNANGRAVGARVVYCCPI